VCAFRQSVGRLFGQSVGRLFRQSGDVQAIRLLDIGLLRSDSQLGGCSDSQSDGCLGNQTVVQAVQRAVGWARVNQSVIWSFRQSGCCLGSQEIWYACV